MRLKEGFAQLVKRQQLIQATKSLESAGRRVNLDQLLTAADARRFALRHPTLPVRTEIVVRPVFRNRSSAMEIRDFPALEAANRYGSPR
jgi:hypothetical protein